MSDSSPDPQRLVRVTRDHPDVQSEVDAELEFHFTRRVEELVAQGVPAHQAREEARRAFGDVAGVRRELTRIGEAQAARRRRRDWLSGIGLDARRALRALRGDATFTLTALVTLAIGIGAATAVFSVVRGVLLRPLPYPQPERIVWMREVGKRGGTMDWAGANIRDVQTRTRTLERVAYYAGSDATVRSSGEPLRAHAYSVSGEFFDVFRVPPALGRAFSAEERAAGGPPAVVVSRGLWERALGGTPAALGQLLRVDGTPARVVGVMPAGFAYPADAELWVATVDDNPHRTGHNWSAVARLAPGRTVADARTEMGSIIRDLKAEHGDDMDAVDVRLHGLHEELAADSRTSLLLLQGAVGFVLVLACVNLASANLARAEARQREFAVRAALGAGTVRLARLQLVESLLVAAAGGGLGLLLAYWLTRVAAATGAGSIPAFAEVRIDPWVAGFAVVASALAGVVVALLPTWQAARADLRTAMGNGGGRTTGSRARRRLRAALVGAQVALAVALLAGGGLLVRSLRALLAESLGVNPERVLTADVTLPRDAYPDTARIHGYYAELVDRLAAVPGARAAAVVSVTPLAVWNPTSQFAVDGGAEMVGAAGYRVVSPAYFDVMGIPLRRGRLLDATDRPGAAHAAVISEAAARRYWPNESPMGHRVRFPGMDQHPDVWLTIVGVVGDVRQEGLDVPPAPDIYVSYAQRPERLNFGTLVVRAAGDPATLAAAVRRAVRDRDPNVPVQVATMEGVVARSVAPRRFTTAVLTGFAVLGLLLAAVGIYGVLSYSVAQRRRELSVRIALGGTGRHIRWVVARDALAAVLPGMLVGVAAAVALTRSMRALVYGVSVSDPTTFAGVLALLLAVAAVASWLPARRAARVGAVLALRGD